MDADIPDVVPLQACLIGNGPNQVPGFYPVLSAHRDLEPLHIKRHIHPLFSLLLSRWRPIVPARTAVIPAEIPVVPTEISVISPIGARTE